MSKVIIRMLAVVLMGLSPALAALAEGTTNDTRRIVTLNSTDPHLPAFVVLDSALRDTIRNRSDESVIFFDETLDSNRFGGARLEEKLIALLKAKYQDFRVDVVVTYATAALKFAERYHEDIWPGSDIVYVGIPEESVAGLELDQETAGVPVNLEFEKTIDLALKLRPNARQLVVVAGAAEADQMVLSQAQSSLDPYLERVEVKYLAGLTMETTLAAVQELPEDSIVLFLTVFRDGSGTPRVPRDTLQELAAVSPAPIFGVYETYIGSGVVAGIISSYAEQGRHGGEIVSRILGGEQPSAIGIDTQVAAGCIADWRQIQRWGIRETLLPPDCETRFREETVWDHYRWQILAMLAVVAAQTILIILLALNRSRLFRARKDLKHEHTQRAEIEKEAALLQGRLTRFSRERSLGAMVTTISHEIGQPLTAIQNYAQAATRRFESASIDKRRILEILQKIEGQAERAGAITQRVRSLINSTELRLSPVRLSTLIEDVISIVQSDCDSLGCRIEYRLPPDPILIQVDALQIQLVLVNLINNALHSISEHGIAAGNVVIESVILGDETVQISVMDNGTGISPDRIQYIFEPLYSAKNTGMGMGLAICEEIIGLHGGRIWYEPNPTGGAIFRFTLRTSKE